MSAKASVFCVLATAAASLLPCGQAWAQEALEVEQKRLAEEIVRKVESVARRDFEPRFRARAVEALAALPLEELQDRSARQGRQGLGPLALGDSDSQLVYTPVPPCRIVDTRLAGGTLAAGTIRDFRVTGLDFTAQGGNAAGCLVPNGPATVAMINFVAVNPTGNGNLRAFPYPQATAPTASVLNYALPGTGLNLANGIAVPICDPSLGPTCVSDLRVQADVANTHLVADVVGYFERFPKEDVRSFSVTATVGAPSPTPILAVCTNPTGAQIAVNAPRAGKVIVRGVAKGQMEHSSGTDVMAFGIGTSPTDCSFQVFLTEHVLSTEAAGSYIFNSPVFAEFAVSPGTNTYYLNGLMQSGASLGDQIVRWFLEATFYPN